MNKVAKLEKFCFKIGIFKTSPDNAAITFGPYGNLLLKQIKHEWLRANLFKYENNFLIEDKNLFSNFRRLSSESNEKETFDINYFINSINTIYDGNRLSIGLINVYSNANGQLSPLEYKDPTNNNMNKDFNILTKHFNSAKSFSQLVHLNAFHFHDNKSDGSQVIKTANSADSYSYWQRERKNWWSKLLNYPENIHVQSSSSDTTSLSETNILYELMDENAYDLKENEKVEKNINWLENIKVVDRSDPSLKDFFSQINTNSLFANVKNLVVTQTTSQSVLEAVLYDSFQYRVGKSFVSRKKDNSNLNQDNRKFVFRLDFRLAPFKACIIYHSQSAITSKEQAESQPLKQVNTQTTSEASAANKKQKSLKSKEPKEPTTDTNLFGTSKMIAIDNLSSVALEIRRMLYLNQINVLVMQISSENELESKYDYLDELGVPYAIYLPLSVVKDGICHIRNRDTTLHEEMHLSQIGKQFNSIMNALSF